MPPQLNPVGCRTCSAGIDPRGKDLLDYYRSDPVKVLYKDHIYNMVNRCVAGFTFVASRFMCLASLHAWLHGFMPGFTACLPGFTLPALITTRIGSKNTYTGVQYKADPTIAIWVSGCCMHCSHRLP
jgi:hypothetical protein